MTTGKKASESFAQNENQTFTKKLYVEAASVSTQQPACARTKS